jgi:hypothetical protein
MNGAEDTGSPDVDRGIEAPASSTFVLGKFELLMMDLISQELAKRIDDEIMRLRQYKESLK